MKRTEIKVLLFSSKDNFLWNSYAKVVNISTSLGYNTRNRVACYKCKQRHKPPVGASCTRIVSSKRKRQSRETNTNTVTAEPAATGTSSAPTSQQSQAKEDSVTNTAAKKTASKRKQPTTAEVMTKLTLVMERFSDMEKRLEQQEQQNKLSMLSQPSAHSSPKSSLKQRSRAPS